MVVGRIAAITNRLHNERYKDKTGFFGYFDSIDDEEVARALFDAAKGELKKRGFEIMRGPFNPSPNDEMGLLVEGFEAPPFIMMPYNPPYYVGLYERLGLKAIRNLLAFYISADVKEPERIKKIVERVRRSTGLTIRSINMKDLKNELLIFRDLYNVTLDRNWGFIPITTEDLELLASDLKSIADPRMVLIAEKNGVPVGFSLTIPNINEVLVRTRGVSTPMRVAKFLWYLKTKAPKTARLLVLGVKPEFRNTGIAALFYHETLMRGKQSYVGGELSWVEDNNHEIIKGITVMGGKAYKTYRVYESSLTN
jgi:ribosomal protein S18 acetylase RimI-like enzyme